jgi:hypothetical protein
MRKRALGLLVAVGLAVTACGSDTQGTPSAGAKPTKEVATTSRAPFDGEELSDGEVVKANKLDGARLQSPDDGRLRNYGAAVEVLDFGTADVIDAGEGTQYGAGPDSTLLAFRLRVAPFADDIADKVSATVSVDGRQRSLPDFEYTLSDSGEDTTVQYLVAVPNDRREVELELKYADLAQTFDLLDGRRTGDQPDILYRSSDNAVVYLENLTPAKLTVTDAEGGAGTYVVAVTNATLTYFTTDLGDQPSGPDKAWLAVRFEPTGEGAMEYKATGCVVPFAAFGVTDDSGGAYPVVDRHSSMDQYETVKTLVFEVPADLATAKLNLTTTSLTCKYGGVDYPFAVSGPATVAMDFPED